MVMLDSLLSGAGRDAYLSTTLAQCWLLQAVDRGDLIRILEPLLIMLLHPDTARSLPLQNLNLFYNIHSVSIYSLHVLLTCLFSHYTYSLKCILNGNTHKLTN